MSSISDKAKKWLKTFFGWGGLSGATAYTIHGDLQSAGLIALIIGIAAVIDTAYLDP